MVKCHENAYWPKNLSFFAFNIEGYWGLRKKKSEETKSWMFLSMSLHPRKWFVLLQGVQKNCQIIVFFFFSIWSENEVQIKIIKKFRNWKENSYLTTFEKPCKKAKHFQRCKDIDKNIWLFVSFNFFFIWPQ